MKLKVKMIGKGHFITTNTDPAITLMYSDDMGWYSDYPLANRWEKLWELKLAIKELCNATPKIWGVPLPRWTECKDTARSL